MHAEVDLNGIVRSGLVVSISINVEPNALIVLGDVNYLRASLKSFPWPSRVLSCVAVSFYPGPILSYPASGIRPLHSSLRSAFVQLSRFPPSLCFSLPGKRVARNALVMSLSVGW